MHLFASVLAFGWEPEIKGIVVVMIAVVALMGSTYLLLSTNIGARLGFLVAIAALFGWMACMGSIWATYGIGLKGKEPTWVGRDVVNDGDLANASSAIIRNPDIPNATTDQKVDGWRLLEVDNPKRGQAVASADDIVQNKAKIFKAGEYQATNVWDKGGERYPLFFTFNPPDWWIGVDPGDEWHFDWLSFWHKPHYSLVEMKALVPQNAEPGKAPPRPVIDESQPPRYVLMERDLGTKRQPAFFIAIGSTIIFVICCWMLHRRDAIVAVNRGEAKVPAKVPAGAGV